MSQRLNRANAIGHKLATVVTAMQGVAAQAILRALLDGVTDPHQLAALAQGKLQRKQAELERALVGTLRAHHQCMLRELLDHLTLLTQKVERVEQQIHEALPWSAEIRSLASLCRPPS
jgi:transposase